MAEQQPIELLRRVTKRLESQAFALGSADGGANGEAMAIELRREAAALRWALGKLDPLCDGQEPLFDRICALPGPGQHGPTN